MTAESIKSAMAILGAVYEAILESGSRGIPTGHLYAMLMGKMDILTYAKMIELLKDQGLVTEDRFVLRVTEGGAK